MNYYFTSESVSSGHPDKVADQISDAVLDAVLEKDRDAHVACETLVTTGTAIISGEITTDTYVDIQQIVRTTINEIGYNTDDVGFNGNDCSVMPLIHEQSPDIAMGVNREEGDQGAGDQGIMFGYAVKDGINYMPLEIMLSHKILQELEHLRRELSYLRPDAKSQVTIEYDEDNRPVKIDTIVVSHQHVESATQDLVRETVRLAIHNVKETLPDWITKLFYDYKLYVNPTGKFVIGGPDGDTGLTGRKIIVDTYGGRCPHGGGAFSGKDPSKVDRSAAYYCRYIAKNLVAAGVADEVTIQVSYAIGRSEPISIFINTNGTNNTKYSDAEVAMFLKDNIKFTPKHIIDHLQLLNPIYKETAKYGHFGRESYVQDGITFFPWEKLDLVETFKELLK